MSDQRAEIIDRYFERNYEELFGPYNVPVGEVILDKAQKYVVRPSTVAAFVEKESGGKVLRRPGFFSSPLGIAARGCPLAFQANLVA